MGCLRRLIAIFLGCSCILAFVKAVKSENKEGVETFSNIFGNDENWKEVISLEESRAFPKSYPPQQVNIEPSSRPKRRRLRKRKRRPMTTTTESAESYEQYYRGTLSGVRRKTTTLQDSWEEILKQPQIAHNKRRKNPPEYEAESLNPSLTASMKFGSENIEFSKRNPNTNKPTSPEITDQTWDIKALLKQSGQVSLSEILQKKNLTLGELLKGNRKAISALKSTTTEHTQSFIESWRDEPQMVQTNMEFGTSKIQEESKKGAINRNLEPEDHSIEVFAEDDGIKQLSTKKYNNMYSGITKFEVITEPTTEKRIFVPSHPVLYTTVNYKNQPQQSVISSTSKPHSSNVKKPSTSTKPVLESKSSGSPHKNLPITNAKLNKRIQLKDTFPQETNDILRTTLPPNAIRIDLTEIFGYKTKEIFARGKENDVEKESKANIMDGPLRFSLGFGITSPETSTSKMTPTATNLTSKKPEAKTTQKIEQFLNKHKPLTPGDDIIQITTTIKSPSIKKPETTTAPKIENLPNKYKPLTPRDEIIQIIKDPHEKDSLISILEKRNMTLEELIEQRKRGSSHTHLADIFHNKIKEPEPSGETYIGHMEMPKNYSQYMRKQKSLLDNVKISSTTTTTTIKPPIVPQKVIVTSFPAVKIEIQKDLPERSRVNVEKLIIPDPIQFTNSKEDRITLLDNNFLEDSMLVDNSDTQLYIPSGEPLHLDEEAFINKPSGVKSAILASFAIIGLSILVFLSILVIFRWNQRRKNKLNYCKSFGFNKSPTKSPIISVPNRKIKTFVNETLGKQKDPYKSYMHTSMDNLWESKLRSNY